MTAAAQARWLVIGATVAALVATVVGMGFVQQQFFPTSARAELFIETRMPEGSSIEATAKAALAAEALVRATRTCASPRPMSGQARRASSSR